MEETTTKENKRWKLMQCILKGTEKVQAVVEDAAKVEKVIKEEELERKTIISERLWIERKRKARRRQQRKRKRQRQLWKSKSKSSEEKIPSWTMFQLCKMGHDAADCWQGNAKGYSAR